MYKIDWRDAAAKQGWQWIPDINAVHYDVYSVGWLMSETKDYYVLAQSLTAAYQAGECLQIPKKWVTKVTKIKGAPTIELVQ